MSCSSKNEKLTRIRTMFYRHDRHTNLEAQFDRLLDRRREEIKQGVRAEARGIALIGTSGSGKTTAVDRLLSRHKDLLLPQEGQRQADVISFQVPSPATLKDVGMAVLSALGYPLQRDRSAGIIWNHVRKLLQEREVLFLHIDEAQDLYTVKGDQALINVINTLKSLMQNKDWPVGIILSGMPKVGSMLNFDGQLARRFYPIELKPVSIASDDDLLHDVLSAYSAQAGLKLSTEIVTETFLLRMIHSAAYEFGLIIEILIAAIEEALSAEVDVLEQHHFALAFRIRSGCVDGLNPFVIEDFLTIDPRKLLGGFDGGLA